jgi:hypothetical protein
MNIFQEIKDLPQEVFWGQLVETKKDSKEIYEVELILPFKCVTADYHNEEGQYQVICVKVLKDCRLHNEQLFEGQLVVMSFPSATLRNAWVQVNQIFRDQIEDSHNIYLKFIKKSKQNLFIMGREKRKPTQEQIEFAHKYYNSQRKRND